MGLQASRWQHSYQLSVSLKPWWCQREEQVSVLQSYRTLSVHTGVVSLTDVADVGAAAGTIAIAGVAFWACACREG